MRRFLGRFIPTNFLLERADLNLTLIDVDRESIEYLHNEYPDLKEQIIQADFLKMDLKWRPRFMHRKKVMN
jgi:16S rRNA (adenine1518-N6/adenine1519-N6)-dimethyltransferase